MGCKFVEVETHAEMKAAISPNTVLMLFLGDALDNHPGETQVSVAQMATLARDSGVPLFVDAAAERPGECVQPLSFVRAEGSAVRRRDGRYWLAD
jgi:seryl-tRNA(Sec) selenium transferase